MNRKQRRAAARLSEAEFARELTNVVEGRSADPSVRRFFDEFCAATGVVAATVSGDGSGVDVVRDPRHNTTIEGAQHD